MRRASPVTMRMRAYIVVAVTCALIAPRAEDLPKGWVEIHDLRALRSGGSDGTEPSEFLFTKLAHSMEAEGADRTSINSIYEAARRASLGMQTNQWNAWRALFAPTLYQTGLVVNAMEYLGCRATDVVSAVGSYVAARIKMDSSAFMANCDAGAVQYYASLWATNGMPMQYYPEATRCVILLTSDIPAIPPPRHYVYVCFRREAPAATEASGTKYESAAWQVTNGVFQLTRDLYGSEVFNDLLDAGYDGPTLGAYSNVLETMRSSGIPAFYWQRPLPGVAASRPLK